MTRARRTAGITLIETLVLILILVLVLVMVIPALQKIVREHRRPPAPPPSASWNGRAWKRA